MVAGHAVVPFLYPGGGWRQRGSHARYADASEDSVLYDNDLDFL